MEVILNKSFSIDDESIEALSRTLSDITSTVVGLILMNHSEDVDPYYSNEDSKAEIHYLNNDESWEIESTYDHVNHKYSLSIIRSKSSDISEYKWDLKIIHLSDSDTEEDIKDIFYELYPEYKS